MSIEIVDLSYVIGERFILKNINLSIEPGKIITILGPNGAGKSTLIKLLAGDKQPTKGKIYYENSDFSNFSLEEKAELRAVMSQSQVINFDYTVKEIVEMGWIDRGVLHQKTNFNKEINIISNKCLIKNLLHRKFNTLSGGEQKRVHFARTLLQLWSPFDNKRNKYLILDEPLSNLDLFHEINFMNIIKELSKRKIGIVLILHDLNITAKYSDFIAMMSEGHLKFYGSPSQVLTRNNLYEVYKLKMKVSRNPLRIFYY